MDSAAHRNPGTPVDYLTVVIIPRPYSWPGSVSQPTARRALRALPFRQGKSSEKSYSSRAIPLPCVPKEAALTSFSLPAAGYRNGTSVNNVGSNGNYWSRSVYNVNNAYNVNFNSGNLNPQNANNRHNGFSVRLAREPIKPQPQPYESQPYCCIRAELHALPFFIIISLISKTTTETFHNETLP